MEDNLGDCVFTVTDLIYCERRIYPQKDEGFTGLGKVGDGLSAPLSPSEEGVATQDPSSHQCPAYHPFAL